MGRDLFAFFIGMLIILPVIFLVVLLGAHTILAFSVIHFFDIVSSVQRFWLLSSTLVLSVSFMTTSLLVYWKDISLTRFLYLLAGFWLGLLVQLLIAVVLIWCVVLLAPQIGWEHPHTAFLASSFFSIALIISLFGTWNAFHPRVKEITVRIPGLPEIWKGKRIVQLSDIHLGEVYRTNFLKGIVNQVNALQPECVVITGDLFDGANDHLDILASPLAEMRSNKGIYFVTGNHETYIGVDTAKQALSTLPIRVLENEVLDVDGLALIGLSYPERGVSWNMADLLKQLHPSFDGKPNVLLVHAPTHIEMFKSAGINLQLSGHTHLGQLFPFSFITKSLYHGYDYGLYQDGAYTLYTTNGIGTWGPPMRVGNTPEIVSITLK